MLHLSSTSQLVDALRRSRTVDVQAYTLRGKVLQTLEDAARRGARVRVRLEADPAADAKGSLAGHNRKLIDEMLGAGVDAAVESHVHAKTIDVDGKLYLDEKNFDGDGDLVLEDDDADDPGVATCKSAALAAETALLHSANDGDCVIVESETFGSTSVSKELYELAQAGAAPRLLVAKRTLSGNPNERAKLQSLKNAGVQVRVCDDSEKLAIAGDRAWAGSANATTAFGPYDMTDWGACSSDAAIVAAVRERLEKCWSLARPF